MIYKSNTEIDNLMIWVNKKYMMTILKIFNLDDSSESVYSKILKIFMLDAICYIRIEKAFSLVFIHYTEITIIRS